MFAGAFLAVIVAERRLEGAIPGRAPIASLAVFDGGFLAGTPDGLMVSPDGIRWAASPAFGDGPVAVGAQAGEAYAASPSVLSRAIDIRDFDALSESPAVPSGVGVSEELVVLAVAGGRFFHLASGVLAEMDSREGPPDPIALALPFGDPGYLLAAGAGSGVWMASPFQPGMLRWQRILETPASSVTVDPEDDRRILVGTAGGILISQDRGLSWRFTDHRLGVTGLSVFRDFFAVSDRLVYRSIDGDTGWQALVLER